ncbi:MAG: bifunctional methylenetetrahydrofolate dehydrogenase/methenyltetrahydrofolate cyclohydrolase FolD [Ruminococcaceae bacterium]|nr:bifunctional methylenetetrahydrofolate dehydrogenase/methenyltetrahydrofolate cyclohydrolase FolD [Oscillospiraceae bacterium]
MERTAKIIDGKLVSQAVKDKVREDVLSLGEKGISVCLAVIIVGDNPASRTYVNNKKKACKAAGIISREYALDENTTQQELLELIDRLNKDSEVNGILCQLPLPQGLDEKAVIASISPEKDVDAFHAVNAGHIMIGDYSFLPCTPAGITEMLDYYGIEVASKNCTVIGRSNIVGKPMAMLLLKRNGTVTICHSATKNLADYTSRADILIAAVGKPNFVTADMVKDGAVVIDVGINRNSEGKLCGDVDFDAVSKKASYITPVPGGVGPMTIATLLKNTVTAAKLQNNL